MWKKSSTFLITIFVSFIAAFPAACRWFDFFQKPLVEKFLLVLVLTTIFFPMIWWKIHRSVKNFQINQLKPVGITAAALASIVVMIIFHWQPPAFQSTFDIEIKPQGHVILTAIRSTGAVFSLEQFTPTTGWQLTDDGWKHDDHGESSLTFSGTASAPLELVFVSGPEEGSALIRMQDHTTSVVLKTPLADVQIVSPFPAAMGKPALIWIIWVSLLALTEWLLLTALLYYIFSRHTAGSIAALFPLVFLLPYVTTFAGHNVTLGNDFGPFYFVYKNYLLDFLSNGHFPLWSPMEGAGFPFFSDPLTQSVYPPNILLAILYRLNQGYTRLDHQVYTVTAICWFSLGLYIWLRSLKVEKRFAVFAAVNMAVSYKMVELIRFPNAAHEAAWYPWILLSLTMMAKSTDWRSLWKWSALLAFSLICLFTAGYPYYVYYLPFLAGPYLMFMLVPRIRSAIFGIDRMDWRRFLTGFLLACIIAVLICGPYLLNMGQTITQTSGRAGDDYAHATMYPFDFFDTLESLVYPPASRPEGWFYFGPLALTLMLLFLVNPEKDLLDNEGTNLHNWRSLPVKLALLAWLVFLSYLSYGEKSYLFQVFYRILPGFSALRGWGRLSIALLPGLSVLLAYALADFEVRIRQPNKGRIKPRVWLSLAFLTLFSLGLQWLEFTDNIIDEYWELYFIPRVAFLLQTIANAMGKEFVPDPGQLSAAYSLLYMVFSLLAVLLVLLLLWKYRLTDKHEWIMLAGLGIFSTITLWHGGPWLWNNGLAPQEERKIGGYQRMMQTSLSTPRKNENSTLTLSPSFSVGSPPKWHFARYQDFYFGFANESTERDELLGVINGNRFFYSSRIDQTDIASFLEDAHSFTIKPVVHEYTGDSLVVELDAPADGYFSFIDNWDENWRARVDGAPVKIETLFGTFKSVNLTAGHHEISMSYCPRFFEWVNPACTW